MSKILSEDSFDHWAAMVAGGNLLIAHDKALRQALDVAKSREWGASKFVREIIIETGEGQVVCFLGPCE